MKNKHKKYSTFLQVNPDPYVSADPEIDITKEETTMANGDIDRFYDEEELGE